ncbi:hypothetical protein DMUE_3128 [Dictyocoela muelleri]|nr:hypothetical protein DMUE_3128 [Dictyocoela muelleri]
MSAFKFKKMKITIMMDLSPTFIEDIGEGLHHNMQKYLLRYSEKLNGILLSYELLGVDRKFGISQHNGFLIVNCSMELLVLKIETGIVKLCDDKVLGVFEVLKDGEGDMIEINNIEFNDNFFVTIRGKTVKNTK